MIGRKAAVVGILGATIMTACSNSISGEPGPLTTPSLIMHPQMPPRPREIRIDNLDPCTLFTPEQLRVLSVGTGQKIAADDQVGPSCRWSHSPDEPVEAYRIARNASKGIEATFGNTRGVTALTIAGFPAVETQSERLQLADTQCIIVIDVAQGQNLQVNYDYSGDALAMTREIACAKTRLAAEAAMQELIKQRSR